jgi:polyphosphate kinase
VAEIHGIEDYKAEEVVKQVCDEMFSTGQFYGIIFFTGVTERDTDTDSPEKYSYVQNLAEYIKKHKLGSVKLSLAKKNPTHTQNRVMAGMWSVSVSAFKKYAKDKWNMVEDDSDDSWDW